MMATPQDPNSRMRPSIRRFLTLSLTGLLAAGSLALAEEKTYNVNGPVGAIDANAISLTQGKGKEKYVIRRTSATQTTGSLKPGDVARIEYFMTATSIAPKGTKTTPPAGEKIYHVSGPIFAIDASSISLTQGKGTERYVISRSSTTQTVGSYKVGDVVRVGYFMTATSVGFKEAGKPGAVATPVVPAAPRVAPAVTAPVSAPIQAAPRVAPVVTAPAPATVPSAPVSAPATRSMPVPVVVPPTAASVPATASTTTAASEVAAPVKKPRKPKTPKGADATTSASAPATAAAPDAAAAATPAKKTRKTKAQMAADSTTTASATATTAAPDAAATATPAKKTRKTKAQKAADSTTSASAPATTAAPDAAAATTPAKKARKPKGSKTGDVVSETSTPSAEVAPTPTPAKKPKKTKKQKAEEAAASGLTPKRAAPKGIQPAEQMPVPTPTPPAR